MAGSSKFYSDLEGNASSTVSTVAVAYHPNQIEQLRDVEYKENSSFCSAATELCVLLPYGST